MKLVIERGELLRALGHVTSVVEKRTTIPILSNVMLKATHDGQIETVPIFRHSRSYSFQWPKASCDKSGCRVKTRPAPGAWTLGLRADDVAGNRAFKSMGIVQVANR